MIRSTSLSATSNSIGRAGMINDFCLPELSGDTSLAIREGIIRLLEALELARDAACDAWEFALEIPTLQQMGIHSSQLRWLIRKSYIEHARETTVGGMEPRSFEPMAGLSFGSTSCFVLTESGEALAKSMRGDRTAVVAHIQPRRVDNAGKPTWDEDLRELRFQGQVIKRYKVPSPNQQIVLAAFDEESWPCRVDDPLMPHPEIDPKRRLHDTIKSLNRHQINPLLRFYGDGTGEGVLWGTT